MKKIVYVTGTRAEFGLMERTLLELQKHFDLTLIVTGMHLSDTWGNTIEIIKQKGFKIKIVDMKYQNNSLAAMSKALGTCIYGMTQALEEVHPDLVLVEGDRGEALAGAICASHLNIPLIHHGGGDISDSIDNKIRYAISSFADYHLVGNPQSFENLLKKGYLKEKIQIVGEPGIDDIITKKFPSKDEIFAKYHIDPSKKLCIFVFHPNTREFSLIDMQIKDIIISLSYLIEKVNFQIIAAYSNSDSGGDVINTALDTFSRTHSANSFQLYHNILREDFLGLMNVCTLMLGNSSSGIIELPSFKKPFLCIGTRQSGRLKPENVLDCPIESAQIKKAIQKILNDKNFHKQLENVKNPYGDGQSFKLITDFILHL